MVKVGDVFRVRARAPYGITAGGSVVQVSYVYSSTDFDVTLLEAVNKEYKIYEGSTFTVLLDFLEPYAVFQGPELPPVYLKIRSMHARQQAKGIFRY